MVAPTAGTVDTLTKTTVRMIATCQMMMSLFPQVPKYVLIAQTIRLNPLIPTIQTNLLLIPIDPYIHLFEDQREM